MEKSASEQGLEDKLQFENCAGNSAVFYSEPEPDLEVLSPEDEPLRAFVLLAAELLAGEDWEESHE